MKNGRFCIKRADGFTIENWYKDGKLHMDDGPAVTITNGYKAWYFDGSKHRFDGPARIWGNGDKQWWIHGERHTKEEWWERISDEWKIKALFNGEGV